MNGLRYIILGLLFSVIWITGCDTVHEFPEEEPVSDFVEVTIDIDLNMAFDSDTIFQTYAQMLNEDYDVRYIIDIYEKDDSQPNTLGKKAVRILKTENAIISKGIYHIKDTVQLPIGKYEIVAWTDFVDKGSSSDKHYTTTELQKISIIPQGSVNKGYNVTKDAFTGKHIMDLTPYEGQSFVRHTAIIETKRPFAVYQIITTDINEYKTYHQALSYSSIRPSITNLYYNLFFPTGYNAYLLTPNNLVAGIGYSYDIIETIPNKEAMIASDIVFVENDTFYFVEFEMISADGSRLNVVKGLKINLKRNKRTIIRADFLTNDLDQDGKIGIDDGFGDEIIVHI